MIEIKFPANRPDIALAMGQALLAIAASSTALSTVTPKAVTAGQVVQLPGEVTPQAVTVTMGAGEEEQEVPPVSTAAAFGAATASPTPKTAAQPAARLDTKGVAFHADFCATAADPFYASGSRAGQWKKRKGVADDTYDNWYATQPRTAVGSAQVTPEYPEEEDDTPVNTAAAFGAAPAQAQRPAATTVPRDTGAFMGWLSERQAAQVLNQAQINQAYQTAGVIVTDLFPPTPADKVATNIAKVYALLVAQGA